MANFSKNRLGISNDKNRSTISRSSKAEFSPAKSSVWMPK